MIIGKECKIGNLKILDNGKITLGDNVMIGENVVFNVSESLEIGDRSIIGDNFIMEGRCIKIGKEFWSGRYCMIGGGSSFEKLSSLEIGDFVHLGDFGFINTARSVKIGNEVGLGQETKIYTHGAYLNWFDGFPIEFGSVTIGNNVWCPKAIIMPNVVIEDNVVVGAGAVVTKSLPSGCLAVGMPAKVIKENVYPRKYSDLEFQELIQQFINHFKNDILDREEKRKKIIQVKDKVFVDGTLFDLGDKRIDGGVNELTEKFKNELRRYGMRFKYYNKDGMYVSW
jgi:acetyltransferase-like isoleucine patch superfamily enzyme